MHETVEADINGNFDIVVEEQFGTLADVEHHGQPNTLSSSKYYYSY
jgi:hypothetical protein